MHSPNVLWLSWHDYPYNYLPSWIPMKNLRVLKVGGRVLKALWQGKSQAPLQLQELEIHAYGLSSIPKSIGQLKHLERIAMFCSCLAKLPEEFGHVKSLRALVLRAIFLKSLPESLGKLTNLHHVDLSQCLKLERLPDSFGSLTNLHHLDLSLCVKLERLPDSFGSLTNLHYLDLRYCNNLERLPDSFGSLTNLHHLDLRYCNNLERLPDSFGSLTNLHHLDLGFCYKLESLPDSFGSLTNLHHVDLSKCGKLERLPDSLGSFSSLKYLNASGCSNLSISSDTLGNIRTLEHIDLSGCEKIEVWPSQLAHQRSLKILKLTCTNFKELPSAIEVPSDLEVLWIGNSLLDTLLPLLGNLRKLKELRFQDGRELKCLPASVGRLSQLTKLEVAGCPVIELPFKKVRGQRETERTLQYMPRLQWLTVEDTEISEVLFDEGVCPNLQDLQLKECINLVVVGTLPNTLTDVTLSSCYNLRSIEGLCGLAMLRRLRIEKCNELQELPTVKTWVSLEYLSLYDCVKLKSIGDLAQLTKLWELHFWKCPELELEGVEYCGSLRQLDAIGCPKLRLGKRLVKRLRQKGVEVDVSRRLQSLQRLQRFETFLLNGYQIAV